MKNYKKLSFYLLAVTSLFFVMTAFTFYFYLHKINKNYEVLVKNELTNFQKLQKITVTANKNYFYILKVFQDKEVDIDSNYYQWQYFTLMNTKNFEQLSDSLGIFSKKDSLYEALMNSRLEYHKSVKIFFKLRKSADEEEYSSYFLNRLSPNFRLYQLSLDRFIDTYKDKIINHSSKISQEVVSTSLGFLIFGFSPLILTIVISVGYLLIAAGFILYVFLSPPISE